MSLSDLQQSAEIKRYLFHELSPEEREAVEDFLFDDQDYFYEIIEVENDLVDRYVGDGLKGDELTRFERSLAKSPERREKIANARALKTLAALEKPVYVATPAPTFWQKLTGLFNFKIPVLIYGTAGLAVLLVAGLAILVVTNTMTDQRRVGSYSNTSAAPLNRSVGNARPPQMGNTAPMQTNGSAYNGQAANENSERQKLSNQIENLNRQMNKPDVNSNSSVTHAILSVFLFSGGEIIIVPVNANTIRINFSLQISEESDQTANPAGFDISLDGANIAQNVKPRMRAGKRVVDITLPTQQLGYTEHTFKVDGKYYIFRLKKQ